jgi:hypothetical protein
MTDRDLLPAMDEAELRALLDRCLSDVQAPDRLHASALTLGHRLRLRRRAGQVGGGLLVAAACTAIVVATLGGSHDTAAPGYAGDPTPTTTPSQTPGPTPSQTPSQASGETPSQAPSAGDPPPDTGDYPPPGWWDVPSRRMLMALRDVLPDGVSVTESDLYLEGTTGRTMATGALLGVLTASTGPGTFQVLLYPPDPEVTSPEGGTPPLSDRIQCEAYMTTCEPLLDPSGATIGRVSTDQERGTTYHEVMLLGPDGGALYFYVADSSGEKPGYEPPSAESPPLSTDQLRALAQDPVWTDYDPEG